MKAGRKNLIAIICVFGVMGMTGAAFAAVTPPNRLREAAPTAAAVLTDARPIRERVHSALRLRVAVRPGDAPDAP